MSGVSAPAMMFGIPLDLVTMDQTLDRIGEFVAEGRRSGRTHQVATVNVDFLVNSIEHPDLRQLLQHSDLNLADGMPLVWASRMFGPTLPQRVAGSDLVPLLAARSAERRWRIHLFGGAKGVAERARKLLLGQHPAALITEDAGPMIDDVELVDDELIERIRDVDADVLCVALGNPKQERFIAAQRHRLGVPVMIGVGGSFDMLVGDKRRAPEWVQRIGAEWVVRAVQDPRRLGPRYAHDLRVFGPHLRRHLTAVRRHRDGSGLSVQMDGNSVVVRDVRPGETDRRGSWPEALDSVGGSTSITFDHHSVESLAAVAHSRLIEIVRIGVREGAHFENLPWTAALERCLEDYGTADWLRSIRTEPAADGHVGLPTLSAEQSLSDTSSPSLGCSE